MKIYTRIVIDMTQDDLPTIKSDSYEYDGDVALCMPSDGGGGRSGGDGDRGSGGSTDSERGDGGGGNSGGSRGFNKTGLNGVVGTAHKDFAGNITGRNPDGSFGPDHAGSIGELASRYSTAGKIAGGVVGAVSGIPGATMAGAALGAYAGKVAGQKADQAANIAAGQRGMPDSVREWAGVDDSTTSSSGQSSASGSSGVAGVGGTGEDGRQGSEGGRLLTFSNGYKGSYQIPESVYNNLVSAAKRDKATANFLTTLNEARSKVQVGNDLIGKHNEKVKKLNEYSSEVFGSDRFVPQQEATSLQLNANPKQYEIPHSYAQQALNEIEEAKRLGAKIYVR